MICLLLSFLFEQSPWEGGRGGDWHGHGVIGPLQIQKYLTCTCTVYLFEAKKSWSQTCCIFIYKKDFN